jgi:ATP-binding cassette, subfamily C, bacterial CydCD
VKPLDPRLLRYARRARAWITVVAGLGVATAVALIAAAQLLATAISSVFARHGLALGSLLAALAAVIAARAAIAWATEVSANRASSDVKSSLRRGLLARAVDHGPGDPAAGTASLTTLATTGLDALDGYFAKYLPQLFLSVAVPLAVLARITAADWLSGVIIAVTLPLIPIFGALVGMATGTEAQRRWDALGRLSHHFLDMVTGLPTLKVFGQPRASVIHEATQDYRQATMGTLRLAFLSSFVLELAGTLSVALVAVTIGLRLVYGHIDLRTGLLVLILAPEAYLPLRAAAAQFHAVADGLAAAQQALAILDAPQETAQAAESREVAASPLSAADPLATVGPVAEGPVRIDHVSVRYDGRPRPAPDDISFTIEPGQVTALTGPSGSGKTTLINVMLGFARPSEGRIIPPPVRSRIAWVPQRPYLFAGTVGSNIRLGRADATDDEVRAAAVAAALDDIPPSRLVTERGTNLSEGQRRRVAIARALLADREILLLDEPTAGLDRATEERVLLSLRAEAARGKTVLIAAHHPAVLDAADKIIDLAGVLV